MPKRSMKQDDPLEDFARRDITLDGVSKVVYVAGTGPAVIVMPEMPGISPHVARFARWVRDAGFTIYMPSLFGRDGAVPGAEEGAAIFQRACVSAEFRALAANEVAPVAGAICAWRVRRPRRRRHRDVLYGKFCADHDARALDAGAGALAAVAAAE
jgi:dienelactone hydrolase